MELFSSEEELPINAESIVCKIALVGDDKRQDSKMIVNIIQLMDQTSGKFVKADVDVDVIALIGSCGGRLGNFLENDTRSFDVTSGTELFGGS
jgi:hypothetical protein